MSIGLELKRLRELHDLSVAKFAAMLNVSPERFRKWESAGVKPKAADTKNIETFFGVQINKLAEVKDYEIPITSKDVPNENLDTELPIVPTGLTIKSYIELQKEYIEYAKSQQAIVERLLNLKTQDDGTGHTSPPGRKRGSSSNGSKPVVPASPLNKSTSRQSQDAADGVKKKQGIQVKG